MTDQDVVALLLREVAKQRRLRQIADQKAYQQRQRAEYWRVRALQKRRG